MMTIKELTKEIPFKTPSYFDIMSFAHKVRMDNIDFTFTLLLEYIKYRADFLAKYEGYHSSHMYYYEKMGIVLINEDNPYTYKTEWLLDFETWSRLIIKELQQLCWKQ